MFLVLHAGNFFKENDLKHLKENVYLTQKYKPVIRDKTLTDFLL